MLSLINEYEPSANNGNLKSQTIAPVNMKQSYLYDARNRLGSASEQPTGGGAVTWSQSFGFDDFGNNWVSAQEGALPGGGPRPNQAAWYQMAGTSGTVVNNRIAGEQYDGAGNQTSLGALTAEYDGAGRMKLIRSGSRTVASFAYDAFGQRVWAVRDGLSTVMVYDALGRLSAEYEAGVAGPLQPQYLTMDQLGSVRIATDGAGNVVRRADFLPFGEEIPAGLGGRTLAGYGQGGPRQRFTGQERETESGVDYFKARYFNGAQGRFTSADGPMVDQRAGDPAGWNLFAYVRNNPLRWVDPSGRCSQVAPGNYVDSDTEGSLIFKGLCRSGTIGSSGKPSMDVQADRESIVSNNDFFLYWITSQLPQSIYYGADDPATKEIAGGSTVRRAIREYVKADCPSVGRLESGHFEAYAESLLDRLISPRFNQTQFQVGGHSGSIRTNANGTVTYKVTNTAGFSSFVGRSTWGPPLGMKPYAWDNLFGQSGPMHNVSQIFEWTGANPCGK